MDAWDSDFEKAKKEADKIKKTMFYLGISKLRRPDSRRWAKRVVKQCVMTLLKVYGSSHFVKKIIKVGRCYSLEGSKYCGCKSWCIYGAREIIPSEVFSDVV